MYTLDESTDELLDIIGEVYDCVIAPERWPQTLERITTAVRADFTGIALIGLGSNEIRVKLRSQVAEETQDAMFQAAPFNPTMSSYWYYDVDVPFTSATYMGDTEWRRSKFYRNVVAPLGYDDAIMTVLSKTNSLAGAVAMPRKREHGPITAGELEWVRRLAPHLRRAVMIADLLDVRTMQSSALATTLDLLAVGIILVDSQGRIAHANKAAEKQLESRDAIVRRNGRLTAREPGASHQLALALSAASSGGIMPSTGIAVPIRAANGADLAAWVLPLDAGLRHELAAPFAASVAVFIRELGDARPFPGELFIKRYGITPAECRVLMMLVNGMTLTEAADGLGITVATVKTHLARLFEKTGTSGQSDLMRLAMTALAPASSGN